MISKQMDELEKEAKANGFASHAAYVQKMNESACWTAVCSVCGEHLSGTLDELRRHKHGE